MITPDVRPTPPTSRRRDVAVAAVVVVLLVGAGMVATRPWDSHGSAACSGAAGGPDGRDPWGGCWPGPARTGVPSGTRLTKVPAEETSGHGWTWDAADRIVTIDGDGAVVEGLDVDGGLYVRGLGATVRDSRAKFVAVAPGSQAAYCHAEETAAVRTLTECTVVPGLTDDVEASARDRRTLVEDSEIDYHGVPGDTGTCITGRNLDVRRLDVRGCENGFDADSFVTIIDSYVHDLYNSADGDPHTDGLQSGVGADLRIDHNVFYGFTTGCTFPDESGSCDGTSAINIGGQPDMATARDTSVTRNLVAGGAYTMYCPSRPPSNFTVRDNYFSTIFSGTAPRAADRDRVGAYGPQAGCDGPGVDARGNWLLDDATRRASPLRFGP